MSDFEMGAWLVVMALGAGILSGSIGFDLIEWAWRRIRR